MIDTATIFTFIENDFVDELCRGLISYGNYYSKNRIYNRKRYSEIYYSYTGLMYLGIIEVRIFKRSFYCEKSFVEMKIRLNRLYESGYCWEVIRYENIKKALENLQRYMKIINGYATRNILPNLNRWHVKRVDYAIDVKCDNKEEVYQIFKAAFEPTGLKKKDYPTSCYMVGKGVNINFYDKSAQLENSGVFHLDSERNVFRFEVQVKKIKIYEVGRKLGAYTLKMFCTQEAFKQIYARYYEKTLGLLDFYSFRCAIKRIEERVCSTKRKNYLLAHIKTIQKMGYFYWYSINTKAQKNRFKKSMAELGMSWIMFESDSVDTIENKVTKILDEF